MMRSLYTVFGVVAGNMALMKLEHLGLLMSVTSNFKQQQSKYTRSKTAMAREEKYTSYKNVGKKTISLNFIYMEKKQLCQLQEKQFQA